MSHGRELSCKDWEQQSARLTLQATRNHKLVCFQLLEMLKYSLGQRAEFIQLILPDEIYKQIVTSSCPVTIQLFTQCEAAAGGQRGNPPRGTIQSWRQRLWLKTFSQTESRDAFSQHLPPSDSLLTQRLTRLPDPGDLKSQSSCGQEPRDDYYAPGKGIRDRTHTAA